MSFIFVGIERRQQNRGRGGNGEGAGKGCGRAPSPSIGQITPLIERISQKARVCSYSPWKVVTPEVGRGRSWLWEVVSGPCPTEVFMCFSPVNVSWASCHGVGEKLPGGPTQPKLSAPRRFQGSLFDQSCPLKTSRWRGSRRGWRLNTSVPQPYCASKCRTLMPDKNLNGFYPSS